MTSPDVSVVISTRDRAQSLDRTLTDLQRQHMSEAIEVIVVNNGSTDETESILAQSRSPLQMISLYESTPGKSRALNTALTHVHGELIIFTDDDVSVEPNWATELRRAAQTYLDASIFCGPIIPIYPPGTPEWLKTHPLNSGFFGRFEKPLPEGQLPSDIIPFGANFAVRKSVLNHATFRLDLGPSLEHGELLGEDTDFVTQLRKAKNQCVYVPSAPVLHHIRPEQISVEWLVHRAFSLGKSAMLRFQMPRLIPRAPANDRQNSDQTSYVVDSCLIHYYCGQLSACKETDTSAKVMIHEALSGYDLNKYKESLLPVASAFAYDDALVLESKS
jgi:glycosyltransferase involved in cell wall biosynthesis